MQINEIRLDNQMTHLALVGKMDIAGVHAIDMKFHGYTAARRRPTLVDLSGVEFITSLGMGVFISCARSMQRFGARMVLLNPQPLVEEAMKSIGLGEAIPIVHSQEEAMQILFPGRPA
ncbi:MAG TPA: STAS domain-containing protein [Gemmataceae bacterium]|nr:STAS domain-containing protein [Gemmataceae bacterium]